MWKYTTDLGCKALGFWSEMIPASTGTGAVDSSINRTTSFKKYLKKSMQKYIQGDSKPHMVSEMVLTLLATCFAKVLIATNCLPACAAGNFDTATQARGWALSGNQNSKFVRFLVIRRLRRTPMWRWWDVYPAFWFFCILFLVGEMDRYSFPFPAFV